MRIIAAIDIIDGQCVRLTQGDFSRKTIYRADPVELAREMEDNGIRYLHLVDLDGTRTGSIKNHRILEGIASATGLKIDFSGGIRTDEDIRLAFGCGAIQVTIGSIAVSRPDLLRQWLGQYGPDKIILGADFRERKVATGGWQETSERDIADFLIEYRSAGIRYALCTDISKDGMLGGASVDIYRELTSVEGLSVIASGGIATAGDLRKLRDAGCEGAVTGKALLEGRITYNEIAELC
ncbi:MAG: 1-(5-phosphoribosyl)-5-[(5-phosphoribosylamino)methylideneamino] imidazole-4-carboxamide isomerase [Bacteroidales bacterium]|jgi:phosphoribosylformimino-5-aminoimidazole carboxamide ribotide isomerase|nr:1-(5-phosphoribosyl)-5-[(5-phosphoribosylamino)methylideneamino] imidazole-4-carboxamide isomerase [Bacteroidales bacterium]